MSNRAVSRLVLAEFSEEAVVDAARQARAELNAEVSCGVVFFSPDYVEYLEDFLELLRVYGRIPLLVGCTGSGLIATGKEAEDRSGFSLLLLSLPQTKIRTFEFSQAQVEEGTTPGFWHEASGVAADGADVWVTIANPLRLDAERWLAAWNLAFPGVPAIGGLAGGDPDNIVVCHDGRAIQRRRHRAGAAAAASACARSSARAAGPSANP